MSTNGPDRNIHKLVDAINSYPGIQTLMSCGGHKTPKIEAGQVAINEFFIDFGFTTSCPTWEAWQSLNEIARCVYSDGRWHCLFKEIKWVKIEIVADNRFVNTISFTLYGHNVDPIKVADEMLKRQKQTPPDYLKTLTPCKPSVYRDYREKLHRLTYEELMASPKVEEHNE